MGASGSLLSVARCLGQEVDSSKKILDFGCGNGATVKELRDAGYDAYGADVKFKPGAHVEALISEGAIQLINLRKYHIPFPDDYFDLVLSEQVLEHVKNLDETLLELARVMKPGSIGLHRFPSRLRPLESHVKVPFSSVFRPEWWMVLWTQLGFHKPGQEDSPVRDTARKNREYLTQSTHYISGRSLSRHFRKRFRVFGYAESCWFANSPNRRGRLLGKIVGLFFFVPWVYRTFWTRMIYHIK